MLRVSIITVCYNSERTIRRTIESVLGQTYPNIEYIIVDGGSRDRTVDIIREYVELSDGRLSYVSEPDQGIYDAMNKGIRQSSGELTGILNSDDYYEPQAVEHMVDSMRKERYQILYGFMRSWKGDEVYSVGRQSHLFLKECMINHPACFVTKAVYDDFGYFDLQYVSVADYAFMLRMSEIPEVKFYPVNDLIANFSIGGMCATDRAWLDLLKLRKNYGMISAERYKWELFKNKLYHLLTGSSRD